MTQPVTRRLFNGTFLAACMVGPAHAQPAPPDANGEWTHAVTLMGQPKYGPDFTHFDYADPKAPKGGLVRLGSQGGFDNFNIVVSGLKGDLEGGIQQIYDTLTTESSDEPFSSYGLLAEAIRIAPDLGSVTYRLEVPSDASVALPGNYLFFALDDRGTPSRSQQVNIPLG